MPTTLELTNIVYQDGKYYVTHWIGFEKLMLSAFDLDLKNPIKIHEVEHVIKMTTSSDYIALLPAHGNSVLLVNVQTHQMSEISENVIRNVRDIHFRDANLLLILTEVKLFNYDVVQKKITWVSFLPLDGLLVGLTEMYILIVCNHKEEDEPTIASVKAQILLYTMAGMTAGIKILMWSKSNLE